MPTIPTYGDPKVRQTPIPDARVQGPVYDIAGQIGSLAQKANNVSYLIDRQQQIEQDRADDIRVEEQVNRLRETQLDLTLNPETGYSSQLGRNAMERKSGKPLSAEYTESFQKSTQEIMAGLANDNQRQKFQRRAMALGTEFRQGLVRHEAAQIRAYGNQVDEGVVKVETENAARNWSDPAAIELSLLRIDSALERKRQRDGLSAELMTDVRRDIRSGLHKGVLLQALGANNFKYVNEYMKSNAGDLNAKDALEVQVAYRREDVANFAISEASKIVREAETQSSPSAYNSLVSIVAQTESGNRQFTGDGQPVTSSKGAVGAMQVMPTTGPEAAKLAGVPWSLERLKTDEAYNRKLGEAYLQEQLRANKGDVAKALAAYNAGPGALATAMEAAAKAGKPEDWLSRLPKETQDYVQKISGALTAGIQAPRITLLDLEREIEKRAGNDLEKRRAGVQEVQRQWQALESQRKQRDEEVLNTAYKMLEANGGNYSALPLEVRRRIPGDKIDNVRNFAKSAAKWASGADNETDRAAYFFLSDETNLRGMAASDFYQYRTALSETDFKHFTNEYRKANGQAAQNKAEDINSAEVSRVLNNRLGGMKIDIEKARKNPSSDDAQRLGAIRRYVDQEILVAQKAKGDKLTDGEIQTKIDSLFAIDQKFRESGLFSTGDWQSRKLLDTKLSDIPGDVRKQIEAGFKARGVTPNDQDILTMYLRMRTAQVRQ